MSRNKPDLQNLPQWLQYLIAAVVMGGIAAAGWYIGRDRPVPLWIKGYLIPGLGWLGLFLIIVAVADWFRRRR